MEFQSAREDEAKVGGVAQCFLPPHKIIFIFCGILFDPVENLT